MVGVIPPTNFKWSTAPPEYTNLPRRETAKQKSGSFGYAIGLDAIENLTLIVRRPAILRSVRQTIQLNRREPVRYQVNRPVSPETF